MSLFSTPKKNNKGTKSKKSKKTTPNTAQKTIPYKAAYDCGIIETDPQCFTKSYRLDDVNFKIASQNDQDYIFLKYGDMLNMFGSDVKAEITIYNKNIAQEEFNDSVLMKYKGDGLDEYREEQNAMILQKVTEGKNNIIREKYLTISIEAENINAAQVAFSRLDAEVSNAVKQISGNDTPPMNLIDRLSILYSIYNPAAETPLYQSKTIDGHKVESFNTDELRRQGITTKDVIAPTDIVFNSDYFTLDNQFGQTLYLQNLPSFLSTDFIGELNDVACNMLTSVHFESLRQDKAMKLIKNQITNINSNVVDAQKKATKSGYSADLISPTLLEAKIEADKLLGDMTSRNQKLFYVTLAITHFASTKEQLDKQTEQLTAIAQKYLVTIKKLTTQQELGFNTTLPLALNQLYIKRLLTTESASLFIPYSAQELNHAGGLYYGLNAVSHNLILFDRTKSKNSNGIILGTPGSGKSFSAKREIMSVLLSTDSDVYIIDPEGEYTPLAKVLGGEVIKIAAGTKVYVNPLDMDLDYADDKDPVTLKADFICSLCETILGGRYGLSVTQHSIIDRCVRRVYQPYLEYMRNHPELGTCDKAHTPTLKHLYNEILAQEEGEARTIALALERFVTGSLDMFAHRTNVDTSNRFIVYDIKDIGNGLKELGLQVCLNDIWNKTIANKKRHKRTWFYIDEFYLLTQTESSALFLQQIFKRARKWGGVPTGITQNVEDLLISPQARSILSNCDFVMMLNQSPNDKQDLAKMFNISSTQLSYITNADAGQGLLYTGKSIIPFIDKFPTDTKSFAAMTSRMDDADMQKEMIGVESGIDD